MAVQDTLEIGDFILYNALIEEYEDAEVTAGVREAIEENHPFINYMMVMTPVIVHFYSDSKIAKNEAYIKIFKKPNYEGLFDGFISYCESVKATGIPKLKTALSFVKMPFGEKSFSVLFDFLYTNRTKLKGGLSKDSASLFNQIYKAIMSDDTDEDAVNYLVSHANKIEDILVRKLILTLKDVFDFEDVEDEFLSAKTDAAAITKKFFKTATPSLDEIKLLESKKKEKYKEWRKSLNNVKRLQKLALEKYWVDNGMTLRTPIPVPTARKICKNLEIPDPIDSGFEGKVSLALSEGTLFSYWTKYDLELNCPPGRNVVMNPKYNNTDNTYYCTSLSDMAGPDAKPQKIYSKKWKSKSSNDIHATATAIAHVIEDMRITWIKDMKVLLKGEPTTKGLVAIVSRVLDLTGARIGNRASEKTAETYGIHNLQVKHIKTKEGAVRIAFEGKDNVKHVKIINDPMTANIIKKLVKGKKPSEYVFSLTGKAPISDVSVRGYLKSIGFPGSPHRLREYHACRIFSEMTETAKGKPEAVFDKAVSAAADFLGNTIPVCIGTYISPTLMENFFKKHNTPMPKTVKNAIVNIKFKDK